MHYVRKLAVNIFKTLCRPGKYNLSFPVLIVQISARGRVELPENGTVLMTFDIPEVISILVT